MAEAADLRKKTAVMLATFTFILLVWDVKVAYNNEHGDTISELLRDLSHNWLVLPYALMVVMGHLFWNRPASSMPDRQTHLKRFFVVVFGSGCLLLVRDLLNLAFGLPDFPYANLVVGVVGFFVGAKWWPQAFPTGEEQDASVH